MSRRDEAQRLWERAFNEGVPKPRQPSPYPYPYPYPHPSPQAPALTLSLPRQPCSVRVLGVRCVRPLRWPPPDHEAPGQAARGQAASGQAARGQAREEGVPGPSPGLSDSPRATHAAPVTAELPPPALVSKVHTDTPDRAHNLVQAA